MNEQSKQTIIENYRNLFLKHRSSPEVGQMAFTLVPSDDASHWDTFVSTSPQGNVYVECSDWPLIID